MDDLTQRPFAMAEVRPMIGPDQARVNITWKGQNAELPDPVAFDASDADVKQWVTEAVRAGIPGITADAAADFGDFVVDRFAGNDTTPYNRLMIRPKTPFGGGTGIVDPGGIPADLAKTPETPPAAKPKIRVWTGDDSAEMTTLISELEKTYEVERLPSGSTIVLFDRGNGWKEYKGSYAELLRNLILLCDPVFDPLDRALV